MRRILPVTVSVVDPAAAVARQVERLLIERPSLWCTPDLKSGLNGAEGDRHRFFTTGRPHVLSSLLHSITGQAMRVERVAWRNGRLQIGGIAIPGECPNCAPLRKESKH
jgi:glutamate racemase